MTYAEYEKLEGLSSSLLARFYESQDHALMTPEPSPPLELGKCFEKILEDRVTGSNLFSEKYFECDIQGSMPKDLPGWIFDGDDLNEKFRLKKDGERNAQSKTLHMYLDACLEHPSKIPVGKKDSDMLGRAVNNLLKMKIKSISKKYTLEEILKLADFQVCFQWSKDGIKKKALADAIIVDDDWVLIFDFKLYASFSNFRKALKRKQFIQSIHYCEGCQTIHGPTKPMWFLVASKEEPYLAKPFQVDRESELLAEDAYWKLCRNFVVWDEAGRPPRGWLDTEYVKLYFNN